MCGVPPVTSRTLDAAVETWSAAVGGMADYWSAAIAERERPLDVALDGMRWWQLMTDRRPPQWASRQRIVRRSPLTRLRDFTPAPRPTSCPRSSCRRRPATTPASSTTAPSRARCRRSSPPASSASTRWTGSASRRTTKDATITDYLAEVDAAVRRPATAATSTSWATARAAGWPPIYAALHPERVNTLTIAGAPIDFHAGDAVIHESVQALERRRPVLLPRAGRSRQRRAEGRVPARRLHRHQARERGRQAAAAARQRPRCPPCRALPRLRGLVQAHPGRRRALLSVARRAPLPRQRAHRRNAAHRRRGGRPRPHRLPREPPGRRHRPHHAARAGLRARGRGLDARQAHHATHDVGRPSRAVHGHRGAARPLAGRHGVACSSTRARAQTSPGRAGAPARAPRERAPSRRPSRAPQRSRWRERGAGRACATKAR